MDPVSDLNLVAEKIREALAQIQSLRADRALEGIERKLSPLADQIQSLAGQFQIPETKERAVPSVPARDLTQKPTEMMGWLAESGRVFEHFQHKHSPDRETLLGMIRWLLADAPPPVAPDIEDPGSVSSEWDMSDSVHPSQKQQAATAKRPHSDKIDDDTGSVASEWDSDSRN